MKKNKKKPNPLEQEMNSHGDELNNTRFNRLLVSIKNHKIISVFLVIGVGIISIATVLNSGRDIVSYIFNKETGKSIPTFEDSLVTKKQRKNMKPIVIIDPILKGTMAPIDLLTAEKSIYFITDKSLITNNNNKFLFGIKGENFELSFSVQQEHFVLRRNKEKVFISLPNIPDDQKIVVAIRWSPTLLEVTCAWEDERKTMEINTIPVLPPSSLITWARKSNLIEVQEYKSLEDLRTKVHSCLLSIQDKIEQSGMYDAFWNTSQDKPIQSRIPKRETEVHPTIHGLLHDQAILSSLEIIPEYKTGIGNLDFLILGKIEGDSSLGKIFVEFKNAHSKDIESGIINQLPAYMRNKNAEYGVYCVLNYFGEWFEDKTPGIMSKSMEIEAARFKNNDPIQQHIRIITYNLSKPMSASKQR